MTLSRFQSRPKSKIVDRGRVRDPTGAVAPNGRCLAQGRPGGLGQERPQTGGRFAAPVPLKQEASADDVPVSHPARAGIRHSIALDGQDGCSLVRQRQRAHRIGV